MSCCACDEPILPGEPVSPVLVTHPDGTRRQMHVECALREVMGGAGHWEDHAYWCGERHDPDGGLSVRESARRVWARLNEGTP